MSSSGSQCSSTSTTLFDSLWDELIKEDESDPFSRCWKTLSEEERRAVVQQPHPKSRMLLLHKASDLGNSSAVDALLKEMENLDDHTRVYLLWLKDSEDFTALRYACSQRHANVVRQLLNPPWPQDDPPQPTTPQVIPVTVNENLLSEEIPPEITQDILRHSRKNPLHQFNRFGQYYSSLKLPKDSLEDAVPVVVVGQKNSGKSTLIKSLQVQGFFSRMYHAVVNMNGRNLCRAGIIPTAVSNHGYLGRAVLYELSGNREFVHAAVLNCGHLSDAIFIIVIDTRENIDTMIRHMIYWVNFIRFHGGFDAEYNHSPNIAFVGSHRDIVKVGRFDSNSRFMYALHSARDRIPDFRTVTRVTTDCRKATAEIWHLQYRLYYELQRLRRHRSAIPSICYVLHSVVLALCEEKSERAITIGDLLEELSTSSQDHYALLPQDPLEIAGYSDQLHHLNVLVFLRDKEQLLNSYLISDACPLLNEIEAVFFAERNDPIPAFQASQSITTQTRARDGSRLSLIFSQSNTGALTKHALVSKIQSSDNPITTNAELVISVMKHFRYCDEIALPQTPPAPPQLCYYIPHLLPEELEYDLWSVQDPDRVYLTTWAMVPDNFVYFMPHLIHKLLLRLSLSSIAPINRSRSHRCLAWADPGSSAEVLISDHDSEALVLNMRCFSGHEIKCLKLRNRIIEKIRSLMAEIGNKFTTWELFLPRSRVERRGLELPVTNPLHRELRYCNLKHILDSIRKGNDQVISSDPVALFSIPDLLYFEPYHKMVVRMDERLLAQLGDSNFDELQVSEELIHGLLTAFGEGSITKEAIRLLFNILDLNIAHLTIPEDPLEMAAMACGELRGIGLTYSELKTQLDSVSIIKYSGLSGT